MKKTPNPLNYQLGDFDCVPTSFTNAITYILGRTEYRPDLIRVIDQHSIDVVHNRCITKTGRTSKGKGITTITEKGAGGTSTASIKNICTNLDKYKRANFDPLYCRFYANNQVTPELMRDELKKGSVALTNIHLGTAGHYVLLTKVDRKRVYMFDPYWQERGSIKTKGVKMDFRHPFDYNRKVEIAHLFKPSLDDYTLRLYPNREMVILRNEL